MKKLVVAAGIVAGIAFGVPAIAQTKPTIPVIVKDMTSRLLASRASRRTQGRSRSRRQRCRARRAIRIRRKRPNQHTREGRRIKSRGDRHRARAICRARKADR